MTGAAVGRRGTLCVLLWLLLSVKLSTSEHSVQAALAFLDSLCHVFNSGRTEPWGFANQCQNGTSPGKQNKTKNNHKKLGNIITLFVSALSGITACYLMLKALKVEIYQSSAILCHQFLFHWPWSLLYYPEPTLASCWFLPEWIKYISVRAYYTSVTFMFCQPFMGVNCGVGIFIQIPVCVVITIYFHVTLSTIHCFTCITLY